MLAGCADPRRPNGWIDDDISDVYRRLHRAGDRAHAWRPGLTTGELAGGLYGVSIGGLFAGESMFHRPDIGRDASKVALVALVRLLRAAGGADRLLDVQWQTPHLQSLGAVECHAGTISPGSTPHSGCRRPFWSATPESDRWP